jgi:DnaK suppressor protein
MSASRMGLRTTMQLNQLESERVREKLLREKGELESRIGKIHDHARNPLDADSAEQAAQLGNVEVTTALEHEAMQEVAEIRAALQRLETGDYGICTSCGEEIGAERLEARPECAKCLDCAELG